MKIAVTGATGFIGSHLVRHFARQGHSIIATSRMPHPPAELTNLAEHIPWDITQPPTSIPEVDVLIHAAASVEFSGQRSIMYQANVEGTKNVLMWGQKAKQWIFVSSSSVYPTTTRGEVKVESLAGTVMPGTYYGITKLAAEKIVHELAGDRAVTILRPHAVYGPGDRHLLPSLLRSIRGGKMMMVGDGSNVFSITHIGNFCEAISAAISMPTPGVRTYNIADATPLPLEHIIQHIFDDLQVKVRFRHLPYWLATIMGTVSEQGMKMGRHKPILLTRDLATRLSHQWIVSITSAQRELGYQPTLTLDDGSPDIARWVQSLGGIDRLKESNGQHSWLGDVTTY